MAPSVGFHHLIARNVKAFRVALKKGTQFLEAQLQPYEARIQTVSASNGSHHPIHRAAAIRRNKSWHSQYRNFHAYIRNFTSSAEPALSGVRYHKASFPRSSVSRAVAASTGRAPFASTLRPNLTGGALPRSAGGYGFQGGARYFSHGPASPAEVIQNVSQAIRAFAVSGNKAQYDGMDKVHNTKRYRTVTSLQDEASRKVRELPKATPGSFIEFSINPTITALNSVPQSSFASPAKSLVETLNTDGLLDVLSVDFARSFRDLAAVLNDLQRLSAFADLPISQGLRGLRVHFPGCDATTVERICDELGVRRGIVQQDPDFETSVGAEMALLFPFAPSRPASACDYFEEDAPQLYRKRNSIQWQQMLSPSRDSYDAEDCSTESENSWNMPVERSHERSVSFSPSGFATLRSSELDGTDGFAEGDSMDYEGFEGICHFLEQCDITRR